ncbi:hypothetical protein BV898_07637 [Hypsibius exemplaris]|uniref:Uncharacterized protein n=1 Tax=Hypsibius exemplaris TaxID=2072580 RepID=A0A1W0WSR8_HYPEX|nr:hypothetical protein BV898_07637 [Hypsibius exemplaris]
MSNSTHKPSDSRFALPTTTTVNTSTSPPHDSPISLNGPALSYPQPYIDEEKYPSLADLSIRIFLHGEFATIIITAARYWNGR